MDLSVIGIIGLASSRLDWEERDCEPAAIMRLRITEAGRRALL
jgi:hypothetical protein